MSLIIFILFLSLLILGHEFGHFFAAKKSGVRVEEFGLGYPPRIIGFYKENGKLKFVFGPKQVKTDSTIYSLNLIPFGGFNKILGGDEKIEASDSFSEAKFHKKFLIIAAGVLANIVIAWFAFVAAYMVGRPMAITESSKAKNLSNVNIEILQVAPHSPAHKADLQIGDVIIAGKTKESEKWTNFAGSEEFQRFVQKNKGKVLVLKIKRGDAMLEKELEARSNPPKGEGPIGIALANVGTKKLGFLAALWEGTKDLYYTTIFMLVVIYQILKVLIIKGKLIAGVSGPVGIVAFGSKVAKVSFGYLLSFIGLLSLNLAILNLLPFPALDGGRLLFLTIEKISRKSIPEKVERAINSLGFALLILLMIFVTFRDIKTFF